jgi:hypothetical protein
VTALAAAALPCASAVAGSVDILLLKFVQGACMPTSISRNCQPLLAFVATHSGVRFGCSHARNPPLM